MFETRLTEFVTKNDLDTSVVQELVQIFNEALIEIGQGILNDIPSKSSLSKKTTKITNNAMCQKWASKVAQSFAEEKELTLDDFPGIEKVTKQHMLDFLKHKGKQSITKPTPQQPPTGSASSDIIKRKVQCNGLTVKGDPCVRTGTVKPDGSDNYYCFRHTDSWKDFETNDVSSDSDSEIELEEESLVTHKPPGYEPEPEPEPESETELDEK
jgi:hypothetical protein